MKTLLRIIESRTDAPPSRTTRRLLDRRSDRALVNLRGSLLPPEVTGDDVLVVNEDGAVLAVLSPEALDVGLRADVAQARESAGHIAVVVVIDGWARVVRVPVIPLVKGGDA